MVATGTKSPPIGEPSPKSLPIGEQSLTLHTDHHVSSKFYCVDTNPCAINKEPHPSDVSLIDKYHHYRPLK